MSKLKINIIEKEDYISELERKLGDPQTQLIFVPREVVEEYEIEIEHAGYTPAIVNVCGEEVGIIMKEELSGALVDPSEDDLETLTSAGNCYDNYVRQKYGEKAKIAPETSLGRLIEDQKIHSLILNFFKFPTNEINIEAMEKYGLNRPDVLEYANRAFKVFCETNSSLNIGGGLGCLESVGGPSSKFYSGNKDSLDISSDVCEVGSHYKLNLRMDLLQKNVQKFLPVLSEEYTSLEEQAIKIIMNHNQELTEQSARNLFRMYINLGGAYSLGKALPIK